MHRGIRRTPRRVAVTPTSRRPAAPATCTAMLGLMLLTSKGAAGVTGSGFVALVATLTVMPDLPVAGVAILVGVDRFMSEARALTSIISNCVASIVVAIWENACDRAVLASELNVNFEKTEQALDEGRLVDATLAVTEPATVKPA